MQPCGKWWYKSRAEAEQRLNTMLQKPTTVHPETLNVYECGNCEGWHIGHNYRLRLKHVQRKLAKT